MEVIKVWSLYLEGMTALYPHGIDNDVKTKVNSGYRYSGSTVQALAHTYLNGTKLT